MCPCEKNLSSSSPENNSWICCSQCNQWWHSSYAQILSKDLVKYFKYHNHYYCLFCVIKEVSSNKNHTHVKKVGHISEFPFDIYWWPWKKKLFKKLLKWANKNKIILIFTMLNLFLKIKKTTCRYHYQNLDDLIYSSSDIEQNIPKLVTLGNFCPFTTLKKNHFFEKHQNSKNLLEISSFYTCIPKITIYDVWFLRYGVRDTIFCYFGQFLYDVWFLRYGVKQT